jgi:hypothetical protein
LYRLYRPSEFKLIIDAQSGFKASRCHPDEATRYSKSKHANTIEIIWKLDPWLNKGMNSENERKTGCLNCHGTVLAIDEHGKIDPNTWPNVGVGRINLDGSKGSCTSCHEHGTWVLDKITKYYFITAMGCHHRGHSPRGVNELVAFLTRRVIAIIILIGYHL